MTDRERMKVDRDLYVNEATLELVRRRIESEVKKSFFRSVGVPIGGAGLVAIALVLFVWVPRNVSTFVEAAVVPFLNSPEGQESIRDGVSNSTIAYLGNPDSGKKVVGAQVGKSAEAYLKDPTLGQELLRSLIEKATEDQLTGEVARYFESGGGRELITKGINDAVQPFIDEMKSSVKQHEEDVLATVETPLEDVEWLDKGRGGALYEFLDGEEAGKLQATARPFALRFQILRGERYSGVAIVDYLRQLRSRFGPQFEYCLILDAEGKFLALLNADEVARIMQEWPKGDTFMSILNASEDELSVDDARRKLGTIFGGLPDAVRGDWTIMEALRKPVWSDPRRIDEELPVLDDGEEFLGTTSRGRLISGLLGRP